MFRLFTSVLVLISLNAMSVQATPTYEKIGFDQLQGWSDDDHSVAFETFKNSCSAIPKSDLMDRDIWVPICKVTKWVKDPTHFFENEFQPILVTEGKNALFTGYYEPELLGSRNRSAEFTIPLYKKPPELPKSPWYTRGEIMNGALAGRGLEIAWLKDPVDAFFLSVQGSGRIRLPDGSSMRVGYAAKNGHKYSSIGMELVRRGVMSRAQASAARIKNWVRRNPNDGKALLATNKSYVFFRELKKLRENDGPIGAIQVPVTQDRSIAVDPKFNPLGAPIWMEKEGQDPFNRLMIAQDVGSAIKGAQRADIFYGSGDAAGKIAGRTKSTGRMVVFVPNAAVDSFIGRR